MSDGRYVADESEFDEEPDRVIADVDGREIAVFRLEGDYYAVANHCVHQAGPLCEGRRTGQTEVASDDFDWEYEDDTCIECPWHTWTFDIRTGRHIADDRYAVPTYDVEVEDGSVYVLE